jgi:uncharacterized membrane protein
MMLFFLLFTFTSINSILYFKFFFMAENKKSEILWKKLLQYFFQGLVVLAPIGITLYAVVWLFTTVDNILPNFMHNFFPAHLTLAPDGTLKTYPGLGFVIVIAVVLFVGWISSTFFVGRIVSMFDKLLERTPGVKFIYTSVKDILEAFTGNKKKFDVPVLANVDANDVWRVGFITRETASHFDMPEHSVVYIPLAYSITGVTYIVPKKNIKVLENTSSAEAMKFAVSGGVSEAD